MLLYDFQLNIFSLYGECSQKYINNTLLLYIMKHKLSYLLNRNIQEHSSSGTHENQLTLLSTCLWYLVVIP